MSLIHRFQATRFWRVITARPVQTVGWLIVISRLALVNGSVDWPASPGLLAAAQLPKLLSALRADGSANLAFVFVSWLAVHSLGWLHLSAALMINGVTALCGALALGAFYQLTRRWLERWAAVGDQARPLALLATVVAALTPALWIVSLSLRSDALQLAAGLGGLLAFDVAFEALRQRRGWLAVRWLGVAGLAAALATSSGPLSLSAGPVTLSLRSWSVGLRSAWTAPTVLAHLSLAWQSWVTVAGASFAVVSLCTLVWLCRRRGWFGVALMGGWVGALGVASRGFGPHLVPLAASVAILPASLAFALWLGRLWRDRLQRRGSLLIGGLTVLALLVQSLPLVAGYGWGRGSAQEQAAAERLATDPTVVIESPSIVPWLTRPPQAVVGSTSVATVTATVRSALADHHPVLLSQAALQWPLVQPVGRHVTLDSLAIQPPARLVGGQPNLAQLGSLELRQLPSSSLRWALYQLNPTTPTLDARLLRAADLVAHSGHQGIILSRWIDGSQPVAGLVVAVTGRTGLYSARFDATDPLVRLLRFLGASEPDPQAWGTTDQAGVVELSLPLVGEGDLEITGTADPRTTSQDLGATHWQAVAPSREFNSLHRYTATHFTSLAALEQSVSQLPGDQSVTIRLDQRAGDAIDAWVTTFGYRLQLTDTQRVTDLAAGSGAFLVADPSGAGHDQLTIPAHTGGLVLAGPHRQLPPGGYQVTLIAHVPTALPDDAVLGQFAVTADDGSTPLGQLDTVTAKQVRDGSVSVSIGVGQVSAGVEYRVTAQSVAQPWTIEAVSLRPIGQ